MPEDCPALGHGRWAEGRRGQLQRFCEANRIRCRSFPSLSSGPVRCRSGGSHRQGPPYCHRLQQKRKLIWEQGFLNSRSGTQSTTYHISWVHSTKQVLHTDPLTPGKMFFFFFVVKFFSHMCPPRHVPIFQIPPLHQHSLLPSVSWLASSPLLLATPRTPTPRLFPETSFISSSERFCSPRHKVLRHKPAVGGKCFERIWHCQASRISN